MVVHFLLGYIAMVTYAEHLTYSGAGYVQDNRSMRIKAPPTDQSILLENGITICRKSRGAQCASSDKVS